MRSPAILKLHPRSDLSSDSHLGNGAEFHGQKDLEGAIDVRDYSPARICPGSVAAARISMDCCDSISRSAKAPRKSDNVSAIASPTSSTQEPSKQYGYQTRIEKLKAISGLMRLGC